MKVKRSGGIMVISCRVQLASCLAFCLALTSILPSALGDETSNPMVFPGKDKGDIWVLAGQSNMAGGAPLKKQVEPVEGAWMLNMDNTWIPAHPIAHRVFEAVAPVHRELLMPVLHMSQEAWEEQASLSKKTPGGIGGVGPGFFFARALREATGRPVGLICCAHGGTYMHNWDPASIDQGGHSLYGAMIERIRAVGQPIKGLLWYQGEGDASVPDLAKTYESTWLRFVDMFRKDVGQPNLPIIYVQLARDFYNPPDPAIREGWEHVRDIQRRAVALREYLYCVPAVDLTMDDPIHVGFEGHERLGKRLAETALSQIYSISGHATPIRLESAEWSPPLPGGPQHSSIVVRFCGVSGRLKAAGEPTGFSLRYPDPARPAPEIFRVDFDASDPASVRLAVSEDVASGPIHLYYGAGMVTYVNIVDEMDMGVPAFGPVVLPVEN